MEPALLIALLYNLFTGSSKDYDGPVYTDDDIARMHAETDCRPRDYKPSSIPNKKRK